MSNAVSLVNKIEAHGLSDKIMFSGEESSGHFSGAAQICQTTGATLASELVAIAMTPYDHNSQDENDEEFYYLFEVMSLDREADCFEHSGYYAEAAIDWQKDVTNKLVFTVHGRENAQAIFGFMCSQFFY